MRILIVEDSESLRHSLRRAFQHHAHVVDVAPDGVEGLAAAEVHDYDVIILDIMMPRMDGLTLMRKLRESAKPACILLLTARDTLEDRVNGLREGADDYLVKPFALAELLARVDALGRRQRRIVSTVLSIGPLELDLSARVLRLAGNAVELTPREWKLIECLAQRKGQVVPRAEIEERIYDDKAEPMSNVVDAAVYGLRRKIGTEFIQTRRGMGYVLQVP